MPINIDEIDVKILRQLMQNARSKHKDIANLCGLSSTAVANRIKRLKDLGVIVGASLTLCLGKMGFVGPVSIEVENLDQKGSSEVVARIRNRVEFLDHSHNTGKNSDSFFVITKSLKNIEEITQFLRLHSRSGKIFVSYWDTRHFLYDNVEISPSKKS